MASKDPFNFDDIYKQAGVGDLFVKKTMAEQKAGMAAGKTIGSSPTPPRPPQDARGPGVPISATAGPPPRAAMTTSAASSSSSLSTLDDPFASLTAGISKPSPMGGSRCAGGWLLVASRRFYAQPAVLAWMASNNASINENDSVGLPWLLPDEDSMTARTVTTWQPSVFAVACVAVQP